MFHQNRLSGLSFRTSPASCQAKTHDDVICLETRHSQFVHLEAYYLKMVHSLYPVLSLLGAAFTGILTHNASFGVMSFGFFTFLTYMVIMAQVPKGLSQAKGRLVSATLSKRGKRVILCLPEGEFLIRPYKSPYYRPLEYLARNQDYEANLCIYQDPTTDLPFLAFRGDDEFFFLESPAKPAH